MKKILLFSLILFLLMVNVFSGYGQEVLLRYSGGYPPGHPISKAQDWFAEELSKRTEGKVIVDVFYGGELYGYPGTIDATSAGALDLGYSSSSHWANKNVVLDFGSYFFMINDNQQMRQITEGIKEVFGPIFEEQGVKLLHLFYLGECGIISKKPIKRPEDMKGLIIRSTSPAMLRSLELLGATPASIAAAEQYDAFARGAVDGGGTAYVTMVSRKLYEVSDYVIGPFWNPIWVAFMSLETWNGLSEDIQNLIKEISRDTEKMSYELCSASDQEAIEILKANQKEFYYLTEEERVEWREPVTILYQKWLEDCEKAGYGDAGQRLLDLIY